MERYEYAGSKPVCISDYGNYLIASSERMTASELKTWAKSRWPGSVIRRRDGYEGDPQVLVSFLAK